MSTSQAHALASEVEYRLKNEISNLADALVHIEPARFEESNDWERVAYGVRQIADGMGLGLHDLHIHVDSNGEHVIELDIEISGDITLQEAHNIADEFETRVFSYWPKAKQVITHLEPLVDVMLYPVETSDETFRRNVINFLENNLGPDSDLKVQALVVDGQKRLAITLSMPPRNPIDGIPSPGRGSSSGICGNNSRKYPG